MAFAVPVGDDEIGQALEARREVVDQLRSTGLPRSVTMSDTPARTRTTPWTGSVELSQADGFHTIDVPT